MINLLPFTEALFCWQLANYAFTSCPLRERWPQTIVVGPGAPRWLPWLIRTIVQSLVAALLLAAAGGFATVSNRLGAWVFFGSIAMPVARRLFITLSPLAAFEVIGNALATLVMVLLCIASPQSGRPPRLLDPYAAQLPAVCASAAIVLYAILGGSLLVNSTLERTGGFPLPAKPEPSRPGADRAYKHGEAIGQIERTIVILIVIAGNLQALAFFFAAKGLIRSEELKDRQMADYFLLGSLASFLIALVAGLIVQIILSPLLKGSHP